MFSSKRDVKVFFVWFYLVILMVLFVLSLLLMLVSDNPVLTGLVLFELASLIAWSYALDENEYSDIVQADDELINARLEELTRAQNSSVVLPER